MNTTVEVYRINLDEIADDWETLADVGRFIAHEQDKDRWAMGDLARRVEKRYGESSLKKYATEIGLASSKTLTDYRRVSAFYAPSLRSEYPALSWSHFREAIRLGDIEQAMAKLEQAEANSWPVAELNRQIGGKKRWKKVFEQEGSSVDLYKLITQQISQMDIKHIRVVISEEVEEKTDGN